MKKIELSRTGKKYKGVYDAFVDDEDFEYLNQFNWSILIKEGTRVKYAVTRINHKHTSMHTLLMNSYKRIVDHIDGNGLNNQKNNLRIVSLTVNNQNRGKQIDNRSGFKGVYYHKREKKYIAQITMNRKHFRLGSFKTPQEAARMYNLKAKEFYGPYARLSEV